MLTAKEEKRKCHSLLHHNHVNTIRCSLSSHQYFQFLLVFFFNFAIHSWEWALFNKVSLWLHLRCRDNKCLLAGTSSALCFQPHALFPASWCDGHICVWATRLNADQMWFTMFLTVMLASKEDLWLTPPGASRLPVWSLSELQTFFISPLSYYVLLRSVRQNRWHIGTKTGPVLPLVQNHKPVRTRPPLF